jgi:hypothetical protein
MNKSRSPKPLSLFCLFGLTVLLITGCADPEPVADDPNAGSIINKTTQEIGEFDAEGNDKIADMQVKTSASPLAAMGAYGYAVGEISRQTVQRANQFFQAEHGRFPKDHEEFMEEIIKKNNIQLPVLPGKRRYQYNVEKHELVVVEAEE